MDPKIHFERIKKVRVSDTVVDQIISLIENGKLQIGDKLPSERDLVSQLQVARASVREALRILEFQGIIEVQPGKGTFIVGSPENFYTGEEGVRYWFKEHATEVFDSSVVREVLEGRTAHLAASNVSPTQIKELQEIINKANESIATGDLTKLIQLDRMFHQSIGKCCGNQLLSDLVSMIYDAIVSPHRSLLLIPGRAEISIKNHQAIIDAIAEGNPDAAEHAMTVHIIDVRDAVATLIENKNNNYRRISVTN